jgi:hypothetical protein
VQNIKQIAKLQSKLCLFSIIVADSEMTGSARSLLWGVGVGVDVALFWLREVSRSHRILDI